MRLRKYLNNLLFDQERKINERVYILLLIVAMGILIVALIGDTIYNRNVAEIVTISGLLIVMPFIAYAGIKYDKFDLLIKITSLIILIALPVIFFQAGGAEGASILWFVFYYLYIGLCMTGMWRTVNLILLTIMVGAMFVIEYLHPEIFKPYTRWIFYIDTSLAIVEIGMVCFIMSWFQNRLFTEENNRAREETRKVEELNRSQNRFFSSMSHEIRTPINSILGLNEIILKQEDASEEIIQDAENIQGAGKMLLALINDILDFSRIEAGRMDIVPVNYSVSTMLSEIVNMFLRRAKQKGLEFKLEIDPSIPSELFGDEVRIKQILINLLNNAIKYTKEGSVTLRIEKKDKEIDSVQLLVSVIDTGIGIKNDALPYLFDAFHRFDEQRNVGIEGTGLGLSIVKQLIDLMGGKITVNSVFTQGSTFMVELWQKVTNPEPVGEISIGAFTENKRRNAYRPGYTAADAKILIVDDNKMNLKVEKKLLDGTGMTVDTVLSGEEALSATLSTSYDLILMDHLMPEMDGIECMQLIRKQPGGLNNHVPIVALTANAGSEERKLYMSSGFDGYLAKPVTGRQLEECVIHHLPESKVSVNDTAVLAEYRMNATGSYSHKIPVLIATGSACDLPASAISELQIDIIPYSIHADDRIFYDSVEAGADEVLRYMQSGIRFETAVPTVEEFEEFFGRELLKAHSVIYLSTSSEMSSEYETACSAARAYGNVAVYDTGSVSGGLGLLVLLAHRMSIQGMTPDKIIKELDLYRAKLQLSMMTDGSFFGLRKEIHFRVANSIVKTFGVRPMVRMKNGRNVLKAIALGDDMNSNYEKFVDFAIARLTNPDPDLLMIVYVDQTEEELKQIEKHIRKRYEFENIFFAKGSATFALNSGSGSLMFVYFIEGEQRLKLSQMLASSDRVLKDAEGIAADRNIKEKESNKGDRVKMNDPDPGEADKTREEINWYENIPGINAENALNNCGSPDGLRDALQIFYDSVVSKSDEIRELYDNEDWGNYTIKVHALKSSAKIIGADGLSDEAKRLEDAGKGGDIPYIKEHTEPLLKDYRAYADSLAFLFVQDKELKEADRVLLDIMYDTVREAVANRDGAAVRRAFEEISQYSLPEDDALKLEQLKDLLESEDYEAMSLLMEI